MAKPKKSRSLGNELNYWATCLSAFKNNLSDFPFLKEELKEFEVIVQDAGKENAKQENLKAELLAQTEKLNNLVKKGRGKYASLIRYAKAKYGPKSAKIREFLPATEGEVIKRKGKGS
jgi:hypothetical protein